MWKFNEKYKDSEIINVTAANTEIGFELPKALSDHCSVRVNATSAIVFGGIGKDRKMSGSTYFVNLESFEITDGPKMEFFAPGSGCAILEQNNHIYAIATSGSSTKVLDLTTTSDLRWTKGITYKMKLYNINYTYLLFTYLF